MGGHFQSESVAGLNRNRWPLWIGIYKAEIIKKALFKSKNNKTKAAKMLKIDRMTLYSKIKKFNLWQK
ncbi:MAG: helix-turn-helix domain-containing protein [Acidobacteriota bacterium]